MLPLVAGVDLNLYFDTINHWSSTHFTIHWNVFWVACRLVAQQVFLEVTNPRRLNLRLPFSVGTMAILIV